MYLAQIEFRLNDALDERPVLDQEQGAVDAVVQTPGVPRFQVLKVRVPVQIEFLAGFLKDVRAARPRRGIELLLVRLRQRVRRFTRLRQTLKKLFSPNLEKALTFLDDSLLPPTSNAVERGNRRHRKMMSLASQKANLILRLNRWWRRCCLPAMSL
jgi:hypothetical protein